MWALAQFLPVPIFVKVGVKSAEWVHAKNFTKTMTGEFLKQSVAIF